MFSEPAIGEKFFGRDEVLEILNKRAVALKNGYRQNVALTGHSLSGKSSIILQFLNSIKEDVFIPIYVEVVREPFRAFADKFLATMLYHALMKKGEEASVDIDGLMDKASRIFPKTCSAIKDIYDHISSDDTDEAYSSLLEVTSVLKAESGIPCIVILDEFDNLEQLGIKNPFVGFGKVIMVQKDTMYIVTSSRALAIKKIISEKLSLLFGNFEVLKVSNFGARASSDFLSARLPGFDLDPFLRIFLIAFTDGNPFYLNRLVVNIRDLAIERMTSHIDSDIVTDAILELVYNSSGTIHQYLMNYVLELLDTKTKDLCLSMLSAIASGRNRQSDIAKHVKIKQSAAADVLQRLCELGLVMRCGSFFLIEDIMLDFWIKNVYERKKRLLVDGAFDKNAMFRRDIEAYIDDFRKEFSVPAVQRIADLFNLFSDDLVSLESKNSRMPHFTKVEVRTFPDSGSFVAASFRGNYWIAQVYERDVNENDVVNMIRNVKSLGYKISNKVIIPLKGMDENARLLAKELKITIWDSITINRLLSLYRKKRVIAV